MARNLMPELAKLLGVELGERFRVKVDGHLNNLTEFWFTADNLVYELPPDREGKRALHPASENTITFLLYGNYEVVKRPWVPKIGESYWYVMLISDINRPQTTYGEMKANLFSLVNLIHGNYFRTQEEAEAAKWDFIKQLSGLVKEVTEMRDNAEDK